VNSLLQTWREQGRWSRSTVELEFPRCVASFDNYPAAQQAVDTLAAGGFPVQQVAIVGHGLRSVERVTGPARPWGTAVGGLIGAWFGLFGATFASASAAHRAGFVLTSVVFGALAGLVWAQLHHFWLHRDFVSVTQVLADRYELTVPHHLAEQARQLLRGVAVPGPRAYLHSG
jgi:hypothetical protein